MDRRRIWASGFVVVALVGLLGAGCGDDDDDGGTFARESSAGEQSGGDGDDSADAPSGAATAAPQSGSAGGVNQNLGQLDRKIIFTTGLDLTVPEVTPAFNEVARTARAAGGFVESSNLSVREDSDSVCREYASISIRVPADGYLDTLASLRGLREAKVDREETKSNEVTEEYTDLTSRIRNLQASEQQYLRLLEKATTIQEILTVNDRLDGVRGQIEQAQGRLAVLDDLTALATIDVTLSPVVPAAVKDGDGTRTPQEAFADAWDGSLDTVRALSVGGAYLAVAALWLAGPALIVLLIVRFVQKRNTPQPR